MKSDDTALHSEEEKNDPQTSLQRLQEDMDLFSYVTGHDLLAPLRIMDYCHTTLKDDSADNTTERQEALNILGSEIVHLRTLLQGMQEYIRLETFTAKHVSLDANELVAATLEALADEIKQSGAVVTYDTLPKVAGHRGRLMRLFSYLIDNAIKFYGDAPAKIHISATNKGGTWTFCVADDGIGIVEEHQQVIFRLFQRLHTAEAYPGYGIGLALSQKIVVSHGGWLWVESTPGKGSRFYFTLPAENESEKGV